MKLLKKWSYLIIFFAAGIVYLAYVDEWQVYAEPLSRIKQWYKDSGAGNGYVADAGSMQQDEKILGAAEEDGLEKRADNPDEPGEYDTTAGKLTDMDNMEDESHGVGDSGNFGASVPEGSFGTGILPESGEREELSGEAVPAVTEKEWEEEPPQYMEVEDDYFADAVFIGDSRTVGLYEYGGLEEIAAFYASTGLTIYKMFDAEIVSVPGSKNKITVEEALQQNSFAKIYLMIGINEMGIGTVETFMEKYQESVEHLQELQPDAIIYLQGIIKVTTERSNKGDYINNEGIEARNEAIAQLADDKKIFYLDVNPLICDETGGMEMSYTGDGVHLKAKYIEIWKEYLKTHAISLD